MVYLGCDVFDVGELIRGSYQGWSWLGFGRPRWMVSGTHRAALSP